MELTTYLSIFPTLPALQGHPPKSHGADRTFEGILCEFHGQKQLPWDCQVPGIHQVDERMNVNIGYEFNGDTEGAFLL